ncbi:MAG: hypothetical protein JW762_03225 [Dehalococcoidales bacterium]|nr:hypothetical protein [Dehalococcoidales bacterium]
MRKYLVVSCLIVFIFSIQFLSPDYSAKAQTLVPVRWSMYEVQLNPSGVLPEYTYDRRVTIAGLEQAAKGFIQTSITNGSLWFKEWVENLQGTTLWSQEFSYDFTSPPQDFASGDRLEISVRGQGIVKKPDEGVSGPVNILSGFWVYRGFSDTQGQFLSRPADKYLEIGNRTSYSESMTVPFVAPNGKIPVAEQRWCIEFTTTNTFKDEQGEISPLKVRWIYQAVELSEDQPPATGSPEVSPATEEPAKDSGEDALDILGRIGREVARERIQQEVKGSLEGIGALLTDTWETFTGWVDELKEDPISWIDWPLLEEYGEDFGTENGGEKLPGLTMEDVNEQLMDRIRPIAGLNEESMDELLERVQHLLWEQDTETGRYLPRRTTTFDTMDMNFNDGRKIKVGVMVTPEGRILYTPNGKDYFPSVGAALDPSYWEQAVDLYSGAKQWLWESLFTGSTRNPDIDLQNKVATEVLEDLRVQLNAGEAPQTIVDWTEGKLWSSQIQGPLEQKMRQMLWTQAGEALETFLSAEDVTVEAYNTYLTSFRDLKHQFEGGELTTPKAWAEFRSQTGIDLFDLTEAGGYSVAGAEFAIESVKTLARSQQDTDFAVRVRAYIEERNAGQPIDLIYYRMREGQIPELDIGSAKLASSGTASMMVSSGIAEEAQMGVIFTMYEQAYQRYLLAKSIGRQP